MDTETSEHTVSQGLALAEEICTRHNVRLTRLRKVVLESLLCADGPVKAYDLIERLREKGERLTPATIYRTLDFLLQYGLAHKISCINAYVPCTCEHTNDALLLFVCSECQKVKEIDDPILYSAMQSRFQELGLTLQGNSIEIRGTCTHCANKS